MSVKDDSNLLTLMQSAYSFPDTTQHIVIKNPNEDDGVDFSSLSETDALFVNTEEVGDTVESKI